MIARFFASSFRDSPARNSIPNVSSGTVRPRIESIDVLRGLACLGVVLFHLFALQASPPAHELPVVALLRSLSQFGLFGVPLFLCLSGFCLFWPVLQRFPLADVRVDYRRFMTRRARRILPPYYIALLGFAVLEKFVPDSLTGEYLGGAKSLLLHLLLLQNLSPNAVGAVNEVFWSLAVEWQMYLAFPLFLWLIRRGGNHWGIPLLLSVSLGIAAFWRVLAFHHVGHVDDWRQETVWYRSPFDFFWYFALGMAAAALVAAPNVGRMRGWVMGVGCAAFLPAIYLESHPFGLSPANFFWGLGFASLIVGTCCVTLPRAGRLSLQTLLTWPGHALAWLGACSYSVYLVHLPLLHLIASFVSPTQALLMSLPIVLVLGYVFHLTCERPFLIPRDAKKKSMPQSDAKIAVRVTQ